MKQKIFSLIFATALVFSAFDGVMAKKLDGRTPQTQRGDMSTGNATGQSSGIGTQASNGFNRRFNSTFNQFNLAVTNAEAAVHDRLVFVAAAALGVSASQFHTDLMNSGLTTSQYFMAQIIASSAGVPVSQVLDQVRANRSFVQIARQFRVNNNTTLALINSITLGLNNEIAIANGTYQPNTAQILADYQQAVTLLDRRLVRLGNQVDGSTANGFLFRSLAFYTGLSATEISQLRATLPADVTPSNFAIALLAANSLAASANGTLDLSSDLFTQTSLFSRLEAGGIQTGLLTARLNLLQNSLRPGSLR